MIILYCKVPKECKFMTNGDICNYSHSCERQATDFELKWYKEHLSEKKTP
jgi:hypothetical protein